MRCGMLSETRIELLLAWREVRKLGALGRSALGRKVPVLLESENVREDCLDCEAKAA